MGFRVRPERLPELTKALAGVRDLIEAATPEQVAITAPGDEPVSIDAARRLGIDLSLRHYEVNRAHRQRIEDALATFGATVSEYLATEDRAATTYGDK